MTRYYVSHSTIVTIYRQTEGNEDSFRVRFVRVLDEHTSSQ
jgi:hypothetical protein